MQKIILLMISLMSLSLAGCNTVNGMGKDLQAGGKAITKAANDVSSPSSSSQNNTVSHPSN